MDTENRSALADHRLTRVSLKLAVTENPNTKVWKPEGCIVIRDAACRQVTDNVFVFEGPSFPFLPVGSAVMVDKHRTLKWHQAREQQNLATDHGVVVGSVYPNGLLSLRRGQTKMADKAADRSLPNVKAAYRLLDAMVLASYELDPTDQIAIQKYSVQLMGIADMFETSGDALKAEIREYILEISLDDSLGRPNIERWPLMFMKAKRLALRLKRKLASWEAEADADKDAVSELIESLLLEAAGFQAIAAQAARSRALLGDTSTVFNKENAILAWRHYRDALEGVVPLPFRPWFRLAGYHFARAITALERDDMSGLPETREALLAAEACLQVPRIMDTVDAVTLPLSRAREFWSDTTLPKLQLELELLSSKLRDSAGELLRIERRLEADTNGQKPHAGAIAGAMVDLFTAEQALTPSNQEFSYDHVNVAYDALVAANRKLMGA